MKTGPLPTVSGRSAPQPVGWSNAAHPTARRIALMRTIRKKAGITTVGAAAHREAARNVDGTITVGRCWRSGGAELLG